MAGGSAEPHLRTTATPGRWPLTARRWQPHYTDFSVGPLYFFFVRPSRIGRIEKKLRSSNCSDCGRRDQHHTTLFVPAHIAMAAEYRIHRPYVLATLPRPLDHTKGSIVAREVYGQKDGSKKRKRTELVVGIDGENTSIYDVRIFEPGGAAVC